MSAEPAEVRMRLYRGLTKPYNANLVAADRLSGTDFTDCPATALRYAQGSRGVLLVAEVSSSIRVTEELWLGPTAKRFMIWGPFDEALVVQIPAKELRTRIRREGLRGAEDSRKASLLRTIIDAQTDSR
ncbi:MAG TPA: hypothetical protein VF316_22295 [Polyangiaceae bacterium]